MKIKQITTYFILLLLFSACANEDFDGFQSDNEKDKINTYLTVSTPTMRIPQKATKSGTIQTSDEMSVSRVTVLVLEESNNQYRYKYQTNGRSLKEQEGNYVFNALLSASANPVKLMILANVEPPVNLVPGDTEERIKEKVTIPFSPGWIKKDLPMYGEAFLPDGLTEDGASLTSTLVRSIARIDVINNTGEDFELSSVQLYRANDKIQIIPGLMTENVVTSASIPADATQNIRTNVVEITGASVLGVYVPESSVTSPDNKRSATCVIIRGTYKGDKQETFYRMDFTPDSKPGLFGQILRNHRYVFQITKVLGSGWQTPDDAANNVPSDIEVNIKEWDSETIYMEFDGYHYLGVSTREVYLEYHRDFTSTVEVDTELDSYKVFWLNDKNEKDPAGTEINWGESSNSPDGLFNMKVSADGQTITITSRTENTGSDSLGGAFRIEAGRMQVRIRIEQDIARFGARQIYILSTRVDEIGGFGSHILGQNYVARERTVDLVSKLKNTENFGPLGKVHFDGFVFGGTPNSDIPVTTANLFDVLHLPYPTTPSKETAETVYNWVKSSKNRVLIFHYDNILVNAHLKTRFGLTTSQIEYKGGVTPNNSPLYIHPDAPDIILNGPFGRVSENMQFRAYDTTVGIIEMDEAARHGITPILVSVDGIGNPVGVVLGIDLKNQVVYCGDIDLYNKQRGISHIGESVEAGSSISKDNNADILMGNLFAWIAKTVLTD